MGQHGSEGDVADALDVLLRSCELVIDDNAPAVVHLDTSRLNVEAFGVGAASNRDKDHVGFQCFLLSVLDSLGLEVDFPILLLSRQNLRVQLELEALLAKDSLERLAAKSIRCESVLTNIILTQPPRRYQHRRWHPEIRRR